MDNRSTTMEEKTRFFSKKSNAVSVLISLPVILTGVFVFFYLYASDTFKEPPKVEIKAENRFKKTLHVVSDIDYKPYSYVDENGEYAGLDVELINEVANRLQMNLDLKLMEWTEANRAFEKDEFQVIMNMESDLIVNNPDIIATIPTTEKQYVVYGRNSISSVADLYGRRVASFHQVPGLGLDDEISYINSYETIFKALKAGEYEFAICPIQVGYNFIEEFDIEDVHPSYAVTHVFGSMVLHPEDTMLRVNLNAVLIQMQQEGRLEELHKKWISHRYENMTFAEMLESRPQIVALIIFSVLFVFVLMVFTVFQYRNEKIGKLHTKQLQEKLDIIASQREELKNQQTELITAKTRAEQSSKAKTAFLFNISHDIRTPMNAIIGYVELSKSLYTLCENCTRPHCPDEVPKRVHEFMKKIDASSQHLLSLINDVLEMSRIENGKMELEEIPANIHQIFVDVRDMFATQMQTKTINFIVDDSQIKNKFVICDEHRLNRVLLNLISNAYKFTPEGGKISVTLVQKNDGSNGFGEYEIRVKDTGIGMTQEFAKKVFEAFERERTSTVSKIQGTGLGMAITKSIVDLMKGDIKVFTELNKGTEFIIDVKFRLAEEIQDDEEEKDSAENEIDFSGKKLLLVDDIEVNREIAAMLLSSVGFVVDMAADGKEAVEKVAASKAGEYDAVLMDIQMPIMNGYEATKNIRALADARLAKIPIIAMTANAFSEDVQAARRAGMNAHVAKPIDINQLIETLQKIIGNPN